jgi:hypothetical protein
MKTAEQFIENEMEFRMAIIKDELFIKNSIKVCKKMGLTAQDWNENKAGILMTFANELVKMDGQTGNQLRTRLNF